ncbi:MAG TPA: BMP family ABC transporter substrate-binding protein [Acidimicrobiales bacterium]|jgi:basic membrane protein A|nr:BMP family ABC transporter substrate-binding protein [Acidimicrobiales bacterium]
MGRIRRLTTVLGASALVLGTVTVSVAATTVSASAASKFKACVVTDTGGINDKSFNASAYAGLKDAAAKDSSISYTYLSSTSSSDYAPNIAKFITEGCGIIVTVGFLMDAATAAAANAHPSQKFAIVDDAPTVKAGTHVDALQYETDQAGFLGGILAAGASKTGTVATYGGQNFSAVTLYMNGFVAGVRYYDKTYSKHVKVLGWNPPKTACSLAACPGTGTFVGNFTDQTAGKSDTTTFFSEGADIVFPVAGSVGLGSVAAAKLAGAGHDIMWVDSNGCVSDHADCKYFIGTVAKGVEPSVEAAVLSAAKGSFKAGAYIGTLKNDGTALEYGGIKVSATLKAEIAKAKAGIIAGTISVNPNSYPKVA